MNTSSAPEPERSSASGTNGSADGAPLVPDESDPQEQPGQARDDEDDEYEPL